MLFLAEIWVKFVWKRCIRRSQGGRLVKFNSKSKSNSHLQLARIQNESWNRFKTFLGGSNNLCEQQLIWKIKVQKSFGLRNLVGKQNFSKQTFGPKYNLGPKIFRIQRFCGQQKFWIQRFLIKRLLVKKNVVTSWSWAGPNSTRTGTRIH